MAYSTNHLTISKNYLKLLRELSKSEHWNVREIVSKNKNAPLTVLQKLAKDDNIKVSLGAKQNPTYIVWVGKQKVKFAKAQGIQDLPDAYITKMFDLFF